MPEAVVDEPALPRAAGPAPGTHGAPGGPSLTSRAASGFVWALVQSVLARLIGLVCQFALAKLLKVEDFGAVAIALSISGFVSVIQLAGLQEILVQRQRRFNVWATAAFWMALTLGLCSAGLVAALGPAAAWWKGNSSLAWIMLLVSVQSVVSSLQVVPIATLQVQLRLRAITLLNMLQSAGGPLLSVLLAWLGSGASSLVLGPLCAGAIGLIAMWSLARPRVRPRPHTRRWKFLWGDSATLLSIGLINNLVAQGAVFILGVAQSESVVGVYYWAFMLSLQTVVLVTGNLNVVFFPTLSKLQHDPERMLGAFLRAARVLAMVGVPACFVQAACASWFIDLLFKDKWDAAAPAAVLLSIGLAFGVLSSLPTNLLKAAGMFKLLLWITIAYTVVYVTTIVGAVLIGLYADVGVHPATLVSLGVALVYAIMGPVGAYLCVRPFGGSWVDVWRIFGMPVAVAAVCVGGSYLGARALPTIGGVSPNVDLLLRLGLVCVLSVLTYVPLARVFMSPPFLELKQRLLELAGPRLARFR